MLGAHQIIGLDLRDWQVSTFSKSVLIDVRELVFSLPQTSWTRIEVQRRGGLICPVAHLEAIRH